MLGGKSFQRRGAATAKARPPKAVVQRGTVCIAVQAYEEKPICFRLGMGEGRNILVFLLQTDAQPPVSISIASAQLSTERSTQIFK